MENKTKEEPVEEIESLRKELAELRQEEARRKRAEEALRASESEKKSVLDAMADVVVFQDRSLFILWANEAAARSAGKTTEELVGKHCYEVWQGRSEPCGECPVLRALEAGPRTSGIMATPDGKWWEIVGEAVRDKAGKIVGAIEIARDITERKSVEEVVKESEQKYRFLVQNLDEVILVLSKKGKILFANKKAVEASGYPEEELVGESILKFLTRDSIRKAFYALVQEFLGRPQPVLEVKIKTRSGEIRDLEIAQGSAPVYEKGKQIGILVNGSDITERKRAEEALRESEEFSSSLLNNSPNAILVINPDTSIRYGNPAFEELTGFSSLEVIGVKAPYPWWTEETLHKTRRDFEEAIQQGARRVEELFQKKDGERFWVEMISVPVIRNGEFEYYLANWVDITERKEAEEKLKESEERYRSLVNNIRLGIFRNTPGPTGKFLEVNPAMEEITGYSREELLGMNVSDLYERPQERRAFAEEIAALVGKTITKELNFKRKDGTQIVVSDTTVAVRDNAGQVQYFDGILEDITERKQAEERVQHLNLVLRAIRTVNQVIARETDRSQLLKGICRSLTETRGYYNAWIALLDESGKLREYAESGLGDDFLPMKERLERGELTHCARRALEQSSPIMTENPLLNCSDCPLSGNYKGRGGLTTRLRHGAKCYGVMSLSTPAGMLSDDEEVVLFREIAHDIAFALGSLELEERRKKAAEELEESEERYRALVEASGRMGEAVVLLQNTDKVEAAHLFANKEWVRITGYTHEELREISYFDLIHPRDRDAVADRNRRRLAGEDVPGPWEISIMAKDGTEVPAEGIGAPITYQGRPAVVGYIRDITERKKREEEIKHQRKHFRALFEGSPEAVISLDAQNLTVDINPAFEKMFGYTLEELRGKDIDDYVLPKNKEEEGRDISKRVSRGEVVVAESIRKRADGREVPVSILGAPVVLDGEQIGIFGIYRDITERKRAEQELEESEERYRALVNAGGDMREAIVLLQNTDKVEAAHLFVNDEWAWMTGYTPEELRGISYLDLIHPRHRDAVAGRVRRRFQGELLPGPWEISIMAKDGTEVPVEAAGTPITYQDRPAIVGYLRDITERKEAEEKLKASLEEKEVLLKEIHHRVKNNLQVISSLLRLQSGYIEDERYAEMFKESQERVMSMALVHEKLYQSKDLARIDFAGYVKGLKRELLRSYGSEGAKIAIKAEVEDIRLGVGHAIPCGLIINELVSNCMKHAFPKGERGEVRIAMRQVGKDEVELEVSDNGIGLPESVDVRSTESLGLRLVSMLAEDQLWGEIKVDRGKGTRFRIRFRVGE